MLRVQVAFSKYIKELRLFVTSAFGHKLTLAAYSVTITKPKSHKAPSTVLANFQVPGHPALQKYIVELSVGIYV